MNGDIECANGYYSQIGDIFGAGAVATGVQVPHCNECAKLCSDHDNCLSYECSMTELNCNLNNVANPNAGPYKDYAFCTKIICANGYYSQIGDIPGWGTVDGVGGAQRVPHCDQCARLCSNNANCLSYECSMTDLNCNLNNVANPTTGAYKDYAFCTKILPPTPAPTIYTGETDGTPCKLPTAANEFRAPIYDCGVCPSCDYCKSDYTLWLSKESFACGKDPSCLTTGTQCWGLTDDPWQFLPVKCLACCNGSHKIDDTPTLWCK